MEINNDKLIQDGHFSVDLKVNVLLCSCSMCDSEPDYTQSYDYIKSSPLNLHIYSITMQGVCILYWNHII